MYLKKTPRYPIRKWLGKYSAYLAVMSPMTTWIRQEANVEFFLRSFPRYRSMEHFTSADVADFRVVNPSADLLAVQRFWEWLIVKHGLWIRQIVLDPTRLIVKTKSNLGINDMLRLLDECETIELKKRVINAVGGGPSHVNINTLLWQELQRAASRAKMLPGFCLKHLKVRVASRLGKDVVKAYCEKLLNALPKEAELTGDSFTTVHTATLDVGTTVSYRDHNLLSIGDIVQQQLRAER